MRLRKRICLGLSVVLLASATGCGGDVTEDSGTGSTTVAEAEAAPAAEEGESAEEVSTAGSSAKENSTEMISTSGISTSGISTSGISTEDISGEGTSAEEISAEENSTEENSTEGISAEEISEVDISSEEISREDVSVIWDDSRVYKDLTLGRYDTIQTFGAKGYEDVPFIRASDYLEILCEGRQRTVMEDGVMKVYVNGTEAAIDPAADMIRFDDPSRFRSSGAIDGAIIEEGEYNVITASGKHVSTQTDADPVTISLKEYHMPVIPWEDDILMPFLALQNTFGSARQKNVLAYNGKDYYNAFSAQDFLLDEEHAASNNSPYIKALFSGPFSLKKETSQAYADYGYYSICLLLDLTFGHKEEKNITTFDEYFTRMDAKKSMCSTRPSSAMMAEFMLFNYLFDSGHDSMFNAKTVFGEVGEADSAQIDELVDDIKSSEGGRELFEEAEETPSAQEDPALDAVIGALLEKGFRIPEVLPLYVWSFYFEQARPADYGDERLDYVDDTAVIFFNAFKDDTEKRDPSYYLDPVKEEDAKESSFAFFYNCFEDIQKHDEVKNVVINVSDNGGGAAAALVSILGFLSEDGEVKITDRDLLAGNYREEWYHVDTNLDGVADDEDGFGGKYDFYIMCSGSSYSCANALPYFAQQNGLAKVIGTTPGGGDCVLASFIDAYGRCAFYSGMLKLGKDDGSGFVSNEKATVPDLEMAPSVFDIQYVPWHDAAGIADAVHQYQDGRTELTYNDKEAEEKFSDLMMWLFEKAQEKAAEEPEGDAAGGSEESAAGLSG